MEIVSGEEGKILVLGGVRVPLNDMLGEVVDAIKGLTLDQHAAMARGAGLEVPDLMLTDEYVHPLCQIAMSYVQQAWYQANKGDGPWITADNKDITKVHEARVARFVELVAAAKAKPPKEDKPLGPVGEARHRIKPGDLPTPRHAPKKLEGSGPGAMRILAVTIDGAIMMNLPDEQKDVIVDNPALAEALLHAAGYDVPAGMEFESIKPLATHIARRHWYEYVNRSSTSEEFDYNQKLLTKQFNVLAGKHKKQVLRNYKDSVENGELEEPGAPREPRPVRAPARMVRVVSFKLVEGIAQPLIDAIRGQSRIVYDAVAKLSGNGPVGIEALVAEAEAHGFATKEPAGNAPRARWLALELVKKGVLQLAT